MSIENLRSGARKLGRRLRACGGEIAYCGGIALALIAIALAAEGYRRERQIEPEPASLPAIEFSEAESEPAETQTQKQPLKLLRGYSDAPRWNPALDLWECHPALDCEIEGGEVTCLRAGTVSAIVSGGVRGGCVEVDCGDSLRMRYASIEPRPDLAPGDALEIGDLIGTANESLPGEENLGAHLHLEAILDGESANWLALRGGD